MPSPESDVKDSPYTNTKEPEQWLKRSQAVRYWLDSISTQLWNSNKNYTGRPDAILFRPASPDSVQFAEELLVVEVKNSTSKKRINQGIAETLRYLAYATKTEPSDEFLFPETDGEDAFGAHVHGLVVVQDVGDTFPSIDGPVEVIQASTLQDRLPRILTKVFET
jgi:hypothetical protein